MLNKLKEAFYKARIGHQDPEQKSKVAETGQVRLSDHLVRLSEQVPVADSKVRLQFAHRFA
jgi:hypothetical protein